MGIGEKIEVTLDAAANVLMLTSGQYDLYAKGDKVSTSLIF